jgi:hypothetical protein
MCRYCHLEEPLVNTLISPCLCQGSLRYIHKDCLMRWLTVFEKDPKCEICNTEYRWVEHVFYKRNKYYLQFTAMLVTFMMSIFHLCLYIAMGSVLAINNLCAKEWIEILRNGSFVTHLVIAGGFLMKLCYQSNEVEHPITLQWFITIFEKDINSFQTFMTYFIFFVTCPFACIFYASLVHVFSRFRKEECIVLVEIDNYPDRLSPQYS